MRGSALQAAIASGVNQTVRLPRARRPASYSAQLVTRCRCLGMWRRQAALALNGTAGIQASGKGPSSYAAQLPTPTGRSVQQGGQREHIQLIHSFPVEMDSLAVLDGMTRICGCSAVELMRSRSKS